MSGLPAGPEQQGRLSNRGGKQESDLLGSLPPHPPSLPFRSRPHPAAVLPRSALPGLVGAEPGGPRICGRPRRAPRGRGQRAGSRAAGVRGQPEGWFLSYACDRSANICLAVVTTEANVRRGGGAPRALGSQRRRGLGSLRAAGLSAPSPPCRRGAPVVPLAPCAGGRYSPTGSRGRARG